MKNLAIITFLIIFSLAARNVAIAKDFVLEGFHVLVLEGPPILIDDVVYVAFAGDYGFRSFSPDMNAVREYGDKQKRLFSNFDFNIVNYEFIINPNTHGALSDSDMFQFAFLHNSGFQAASTSNNHSMDYGVSGILYNWSKIEEAGLLSFGTTEKPSIVFQKDTSRVVISALTMYLDKPDSDNIVPMLDERTINAVFQNIQNNDFHIVFLHTGGRSIYPNPYEIKKIKQLVKKGIDLVVCTGSHWPKGFIHLNNIPVALGTGNYILPYTGGGTENIGTYIVAGVKENKLFQIFSIPFYTDITESTISPLNEEDFSDFVERTMERSILDENKWVQFFPSPTLFDWYH